MGLDVVQMSFGCCFRCRSDHVGFPRDKFTVKMQPFRERWLNNFLFNNLVFAYCCLKKIMFWRVTHLNASSQHLYLSLLQLVSVFKFHTHDLDVVLDVVQDVVPRQNGIPSKQLKPRIRCGGAANYEQRITQDRAKCCVFFSTGS